MNEAISVPGASSDGRLWAGIRALGERVGSLELRQVKAETQAESNQKILLNRLDTLSGSLVSACAGIEKVSDRVDGHDTAIALLRTSWEEQVRPALAELRQLQLKVAGAAVGGTLLVEIVAKIIEAATK